MAANLACGGSDSSGVDRASPILLNPSPAPDAELEFPSGAATPDSGDGDVDDADAEDSSPLSPSSRHRRALSVEYLSPAPYSHSRQSSLRGAIFNLCATILGGGILSLPFCFALCGVLGGTLFVLLVAVASNFSIYILISCSRRVRHGASYEEVVAAAFGSAAGRGVQCVLVGLIYLVIVAYCILIRDLVSPLVELALGVADPYSQAQRAGLVGCVLLVMLPMCLKRDLAALNWVSSACVAPMAVLTGVVVFRGAQQAWLAWEEPDRAQFQNTPPLKLFPHSWNDSVYALPILSCAFMCHFNVLPLHRELIRPTRPRIKSLIHRVTGLCAVLYTLVGVFGYLFARDATQGNILNNFRRHDALGVVARISLAFTCIAGFPFIILPCRAVMGKLALLLVPDEQLAPTVAAASAAYGLVRTSSDNAGIDSNVVLAASSAPATHRASSRSSSGRFVDSSDVAAALAREGFAVDEEGSRIDRDPLLPDVDSDSEVEFGAEQGDEAEQEDRDTLGSLGSFAGQGERRQRSGEGEWPSAAMGGASLQRHQIEHVRTDSDVWRMQQSTLPAQPSPLSSFSSGSNGFLTEGSPLLSNSSSSTAPVPRPSYASSGVAFFRHSGALAPPSALPDADPSVPAAAATPTAATSAGASAAVSGGVGGVGHLRACSSMAGGLALAGLDVVGAVDLAAPVGEPEFSSKSIALQTLAIAGSALLLSSRVSSVATLWNLVGSSGAILLSYVVPAACYLRIRREKPLGLRMAAAWALMICGIAALLICTQESMRTLLTTDDSNPSAGQQEQATPQLSARPSATLS